MQRFAWWVIAMWAPKDCPKFEIRFLNSRIKCEESSLINYRMLHNCPAHLPRYRRCLWSNWTHKFNNYCQSGHPGRMSQAGIKQEIGSRGSPTQTKRNDIDRHAFENMLRFFLFFFVCYHFTHFHRLTQVCLSYSHPFHTFEKPFIDFAQNLAWFSPKFMSIYPPVSPHQARYIQGSHSKG